MTQRFPKVLGLFALVAACSSLFGFASGASVEIADFGKLLIIDGKTGIDGITVFLKQPQSVEIRDVIWTIQGNETMAQDSSNNGLEGPVSTLEITTYLDESVIFESKTDIDPLLPLPTTLPAGMFELSKRGKREIRVVVALVARGGTNDTTALQTMRMNQEIQAYGFFAAILPLFLILFLALTTNMVELSLFAALFVGSCIVAGGLGAGIRRCVLVYILEAVIEESHGYVILFTLSLSGLVCMMEKAGGLQGFTNYVARFANTPSSGQLVTSFMGFAIFFDDYANSLVVGNSMKPLMDALMVSREKFTFLIDSTSAPIASIAPISSWVGFQVGLIQTQMDSILDSVPEDEIYTSTSGYGVFLESVKYNHYTYFMIVMVLSTAILQREFGPMLIAERKTRVYRRKDGGDGRCNNNTDSNELPPPAYLPDTPLKAFNLVVPVVVLIAVVFYLLVDSGTVEGEDQTFMDKIEASNSLEALLLGTFSVVVGTAFLYSVQIVEDGKLVWPSRGVLVRLLTHYMEGSGQEETNHPNPGNPYHDNSSPGKTRFLLTPADSLGTFRDGMATIFSAVVVLSLAWSVGAMMTDIGADRLFARLLSNGIRPEFLPLLVYLISLVMGLATGSSWGVMSIMVPLVLQPTYIAADGNEEIFYASTACIFSGAVAGTQLSPIGDNAVVSSLACDCNLLEHVKTQLPYAMVVSCFSIIFGVIPSGFGFMPNSLRILIGFAAIVTTVRFLFAPILSETGSFDVFTECFLKRKEDDEGFASLTQLRLDTARAFKGDFDVRLPMKRKKALSFVVSMRNSLARGGPSVDEFVRTLENLSDRSTSDKKVQSEEIVAERIPEESSALDKTNSSTGEGDDLADEENGKESIEEM